MLTDEQRSFYQEFGYLLLPGFLSADQVRELQQVTSEFECRARQVAQSNELFDFGPSQNGDPPRLRRIKSPHKHHAAYRKLVSDPKLISVLRDLITPNIRLYGSKLNLKSPRGGEPVLWHQDWAYRAQTNDDILTVAIALNDMFVSNGCLLVMPGSHHGKIWNHHQAGEFVGAVTDPDFDPSVAVPIEMKAGGVSLHHVRLLHGSAPNTSSIPRRLLLFTYAAADSWPLAGVADLDNYDAMMVRGTPPKSPRLEKVPVAQAPRPEKIGTRELFDLQDEFAGALYKQG